MQDNKITGKIVNVFGAGSLPTIYTLLVEEDNGVIYRIPVDHRPFSWIVEGEGNIINRFIEYDTENKNIVFLEVA